MSREHANEAHLPRFVFRNANFLFIWSACLISAMGDHLSEMALLQERGGFERDDLTRVQALLSFAFFLPFVFGAPLAGWWADRFSRKWTLILSEFGRGAIVLTIPWLLPWLLGLNLGDYAIIVPVAATGMLATFFSPSKQALLPTLVREDQLVRANALIIPLGPIGTIISALVGGYLVDLAKSGVIHLDWNYRLDALTFGISGMFLIGLNLARARQYHRASKSTEGFTALLAGFRYVRQHRRVLQMILIGTVFWGCAGIVVAIVPALVRYLIGSSFTDAGLFRGLIGVGLILGSLIMTLIGPAMPLQLRVLLGLGGGTFWVLALDLAYLLHSQVLAGLSLVGIGGAGAALLVTVMASVQRFVPNSRRGRVFGVSDTLTMAAMVATSGALGLPHIPNLDQYIPYLVFVTAAILGGAFVVAWWTYFRRNAEPPHVQIVWWLVQTYARLWCRLKRIGPCTVPLRGPVIIASNHFAGVDAILLIASCTRRLPAFWVAREHYYHPLFGWPMRLNRCIPVNRENPGQSSFKAALQRLKDGGCLAVFPTGDFDVPGEPPLLPKTGAAALALRTGATIIPAYIGGTIYHRSPFVSYRLRHKARIVYGAPVDVGEFVGREKDRDALQALTERIYARIQALRPIALAEDETTRSPDSTGAIAPAAGH